MVVRRSGDDSNHSSDACACVCRRSRRTLTITLTLPLNQALKVHPSLSKFNVRSNDLGPVEISQLKAAWGARKGQFSV
jgi:hypothetical protein